MRKDALHCTTMTNKATRHSPILLRLITPQIFLRPKNTRIDTETQPIFILSSGRTATQFMAKYFGSFDNVTALHEPKPSRILRMWSMAYFEGKVSDEVMAQVLYAKRKKMLLAVNTPIYLESNPYLGGFSKALRQVFDDPVIIHVVRDPRDFVRSSMNHGNSFGIKLLFNKYVPFWYANIEKVLGIKQKLPIHQKAAGYWKIVNRSIETLNKNYKNYYLFRFEDIFDDKQTGLNKIADIIGVKKAAKPNARNKTAPTNESRHNVVAGWQDWNKAERKTINRLCQPYMKKFHYGTEKDWLQSLD